MSSAPGTAKDAARRLASGAIAQGFKPEALHEYRSADGGAIYWRIRAKRGDGEKWIRPMHLNGHGYELGEPKFPAGKPLYNLDRIAADPAARVWIVEGEKAADAIANMGAIATTSGGAASAEAADWAPLRGRDCVIWPDFDDAGKAYAGEVGNALVGLNCKLACVDVDKIAVPPKGDAADWAESHPNATPSDLLALPLLPHQPAESNATAAILGADDWPEPQTLTHDDAAQPYPLAGLPESMRAAIEEVQTFTQAPTALVASSALSAASVAAQGLANIQRDEGLTGPIGLWFLTIAESGERKSTADGHFAGPLREYEREAQETSKPAIAKHLAALSAWEAKLAGLRDAIKQGAKQGQPTQEDEARLAVIQSEKPGRLRVPRLLYTDATPESLAHGMAGWPSAAVISAEAGAVLGSHAMGRDSIVRNLALLNSLWDAGALSVDRRTSESYQINGARLTISLQAQAAAVRDFFDKAGVLARGVGFIARFLVAHPESTQGTRQYRQAPASWPALATFNSRVRALLAMPPPINERGELEPPTLIFSAEAKAIWVRFYNDVEGELATGGDLTDVRDVASKSADNAARLAALFHVFEHGPSGAVEADNVAKACRVVAWHLTEARRFLGEFSLPLALANAARLDAWLLEYCRLAGVQRVARRTIQQKGPNATRDGKKLDEALADLVEAGRVREVRDGSRREVAINPKLLAGQP